MSSCTRRLVRLEATVEDSQTSALQTDLLDGRTWATREELAQAIFEYVEAFYNPIRRHSSVEMLAPNDYEHHHSAVSITATA